MKNLILTHLVVLFFSYASLATETKLLRNPDIHNKTIVFCYGGDLYTSTTSGKKVKQLTSFPGEEQMPKFSPDGKLIAFTAEFEGNVDVYVMPTEGGEPKRLTYHPNKDLVLGWHPEGKDVLFRSMRSSFSHRFYRLHLVSVEGGLPRVLELPEGELSSYNQSGDKIAFCRTSLRDWRWKRYRGGGIPNIWTYDFKSQKADLVITDHSVNHFPMWIGETIYFISDKGEHQQQNLWSYNENTQQVQQLTFHDEWEIKSADYDDHQIIYECGGCLYIYDLAKGKNRKLTISIKLPEDHLASKEIDVSNRIAMPSLSPDGKKLLAVARGDLFSINLDTKEKSNLTNTSGVYEKAPLWSPDGKHFAYISDQTGEQQIYVGTIEGMNESVQITHCEKSRLAKISWSPDSKKIGYSDHRSNYFYVDLENMESHKVFFDQNQSSGRFVSASWSPDSKWLVYSKHMKNWLGAIHLYSIVSETEYLLTNGFQNDYEPVFDPDGNYLYWISESKVNIEHTYWDDYPYKVNPAQVVVATLKKGASSPLSDDPSSIQSSMNRNNHSLIIDVEGLGQRITTLPIEDSFYSELKALSGRIIYKYQSDGGQSSYKMFDFTQKKESDLISGSRYCIPIPQIDKMLFADQNGMGVKSLDLESSDNVSRIDASGLIMTVDYRQEWNQIFHDVWRMQRDMLWDQDLHGIDWDAMRVKYEKLLPFVSFREDLNYLMENLCAELQQSHVEVYGGDMPQLPQKETGILGIDLEWDEQNHLYRITKIFKGQNWDPSRISPLTLPGMNIQEGDYLAAIDGSILGEKSNPYSLLVDKVGKPVSLTILSQTDLNLSRQVSVTPVSTSLDQGNFLRYNDWVWQNIEKVNHATHGKVGYIHLPDTYYPGIESFFRYYYAQTDKEALIFDIRYNAGGFDPYSLIERINRTYIFTKQYPYGKTPEALPGGFFGKKICITNEWAESGGDIFAETFRQLNSGLIIGQKTAGSLSATGGFLLLDGGVCIYPSMGPHDAQDNYIIENKGIRPDIEIINRPDDRVNGIDLQLDISIEEILKQLNVTQNNSEPGRNADSLNRAKDFITLNGFKLEVLTSGMENNQADKPVVVFENGMASGFGSWETIADEISKTNTVFRYNRPRIGESENDSLPPTTEHIVQNLRKMLLQKGLKPPYLLVSHSFGGAYIRSYASRYPNEIAGLIFVDPIDFTKKKGFGDLPYLEIGLEQHQIDSMFGEPYDKFIEQLYEEMPGFYVEEVKVSRALNATGFEECVRNPLPDVPVHFIMAGGYPESDDRGETPFDKKKLFRINNNLKMKRWIALLDPLQYGKFFYSSSSGHFVQVDEPNLVINSIQLALEDIDKIQKEEK